ncbi:nitrilase family protein [Maribacter sp. CXY002]|uniref:nitrilase family protein n=1 Tax=Maribacter luteocoastalis TaxID=3407671 RepID=UPI003B67AA40
MKETLKIALIQTSLNWEKPEINRVVFSKKIENLSSDVDLIILPEMFTTGFTMSPENIDETEGLKTIEWMKLNAKEKDAALVGSIIYTENGINYNRLFFVKPDGSYLTYDKRHSFTLSGEHLKYISGKNTLLVDFRGFVINPMICYDLRFPVWSRNTNNYDVLLYVANWPKPRIGAWDVLLKARAIENMSYCIGVNRIGFDEKGLEYVGHSAVYNALGETLVFSEEEESLEVVVTKDHLVQTRGKLKFLEDRDHFTLQLD